MSYVRHDVAVFVVPTWDGIFERARDALEALPESLRTFVFGPFDGGNGYCTVVVVPGGDAPSVYDHDAACDAVRDALVAVTSEVEMMRARFGGDELYTELMESTDTAVWVPEGRHIADPRSEFGAPESLYRGVWVEAGWASRVRHLMGFFTALPESAGDRRVGVELTQRWLELIEAEPPVQSEAVESLGADVALATADRESYAMSALGHGVWLWSERTFKRPDD